VWSTCHWITPKLRNPLINSSNNMTAVRISQVGTTIYDWLSLRSFNIWTTELIYSQMRYNDHKWWAGNSLERSGRGLFENMKWEKWKPHQVWRQKPNRVRQEHKETKRRKSRVTGAGIQSTSLAAIVQSAKQQKDLTHSDYFPSIFFKKGATDTQRIVFQMMTQFWNKAAATASTGPLADSPNDHCSCRFVTSFCAISNFMESSAPRHGVWYTRSGTRI